MNSNKFYPRGDMCIKCTHIKDDCSKLPFSKMYVIEKDGDDNYVKCAYRKVK